MGATCVLLSLINFDPKWTLKGFPALNTMLDCEKTKEQKTSRNESSARKIKVVKSCVD